MSLRGKILLLFLTLAVGPLLVLAIFAQLQSVRALRTLVQDNSAAFASRTAQEIDGRFRELDAQLSVVARIPALGSRLTGSLNPSGSGPVVGSADGGASLEELDGMSGWLHAIEFRDAQGILVFRKNYGIDPPSGSPACPGAESRTAGRVTRPVFGSAGEGPIGTLTATVRLARILPGASSVLGLSPGGNTIVIDRSGGGVLHSNRCEDLDEPLPVILGRDRWNLNPVLLSQNQGRFSFEQDGAPFEATFVSLVSPRWTVVRTVAMSDMTGPIERMRLGYGLFVLLVAGATGTAFSLLIGRVMRSLDDVTNAATRIGEGELATWLPPPGDDEVGRLSLALGSMADRLNHMVHQVERSGRLAAVGELASHLAHEVRNPLSSIKLNLQGLQREVRSGLVLSDAAESIDISLMEVERLERVVSGVLALGRARPVAKQTCGLHDLVGEILTFVRPDLDRRRLEVEARLDAPFDRIVADPSQVKGVLMNLLLNAADAMPDGGRLRVWSETIELEDEGPVIAVHVADEGPGIPPEFRDRIFEPFFSTKVEGSGIGLALALQAIKQHGGELYLETGSELEKGSEFVLTLPVELPEPERDEALEQGAGSELTRSRGGVGLRADDRSSNAAAGSSTGPTRVQQWLDRKGRRDAVPTAGTPDGWQADERQE